ncbi:MAG: Crp/Fnr family transcriptional regulator [Sedimenticola sp.]
MIKDLTVQTQLKSAFPFLSGAPAHFLTAFFESGSIVQLEKGSHICLEGRECTHLALVVEGSARVYKIGENGREITLYRVGFGESCILTASCILSSLPFPAFAVAETPVTAFVIPASKVRVWLAEWSAWREYVFSLVAQRLTNVISVVEEVVFRRMDERIANYLQSHSTPDGTRVSATHQEIASDLGTSREVVSRILKDFESDGLVRIARGSIEIIDIKHFAQRA